MKGKRLKGFSKQEELEIKATVKELETMGINCDNIWVMEDKWQNLWIAPASFTDQFGFINGNNFIPTNDAGRKVLEMVMQ